MIETLIKSTGRPKRLPRIVEVFEDPSDVTDLTLALRRSELWSRYAAEPENCRALGYTAVYDIETQDDNYGDMDGNGVLSFASEAAVQQPPLLGINLVNFLDGAKVAIAEIEAQTGARHEQIMQQYGLGGVVNE